MYIFSFFKIAFNLQSYINNVYVVYCCIGIFAPRMGIFAHTDACFVNFL